jgi:CheY-like chemotaxis protein
MTDSLDNLSIEDLEYTVLVGQTNNILIVDDEEVIHQVLKKVLKNSGYNLDFATNGEDALQKVQEKEYNLLIVDKNLPGISGIEVMEDARLIQPDLEFIVITAYASYQSAVEALRLGAFDYIEKPFSDLKLLKEKIRRALARQHLIRENQVLSDHLRDAHKDLKGTIEALGKSLGDVEKINLYLRSAINKSTRELKIHNTELKQAITGASEPLKQAYDKLKDEAEVTGAPRVRDARDLVARTWDILSSRVLPKKED